MRGPATIQRSIQIITAGYVSSQIQIHAATFVGPLVFVVTTFYIYWDRWKLGAGVLHSGRRVAVFGLHSFRISKLSDYISVPIKGEKKILNKYCTLGTPNGPLARALIESAPPPTNLLQNEMSWQNHCMCLRRKIPSQMWRYRKISIWGTARRKLTTLRWRFLNEMSHSPALFDRFAFQDRSAFLPLCCGECGDMCKKNI